MELSPQSVASTTFKTVKKGYDPNEVRAYLAQLATAIESTQAQATAMEARARAAVARLQEIAANPAPAAASAPTSAPSASEADTISRTLLLAQRTADTTVADAEADAKRIREEAAAEAHDALESAREVQNRLIEEAKAEARRGAEGARIQIESEVQALLARREFLLSDVDHLEQHVVTHRDRLREVAGALTAMVERGPGGLADLHRPLMSAVTDDDTSSDPASFNDAAGPPVDATQPMSRQDWTPEESPNTGEQTTVHASSGPGTEGEAGADAQPAEQPTVDATPTAGVGGLFDEVTTEVPRVSRPANDAFRGRRDDRR